MLICPDCREHTVTLVAHAHGITRPTHYTCLSCASVCVHCASAAAALTRDEDTIDDRREEAVH